MTPTYSVGGFGMTEREREIVERTYQIQTIRWLEAHGFAVIEPDELATQFSSEDSRALYLEIVDLNESLDTYFEGVSGIESIELTSLKELWEQGELPSKTLLFSEVVYQSDGICRIRASEFTELSEVIGPSEETGPCIISHFQAKLVDAESGATMWHNRMLREVRVETSPRQRAENIEAVVKHTFTGPHGLTTLSRPPRTATDAQTASTR